MCRLEMQEGQTGLGWVTNGLVGGQTRVGQGGWQILLQLVTNGWWGGWSDLGRAGGWQILGDLILSQPNLKLLLLYLAIVS